MPSKISELFRDHETGTAAVAALKQHGFSDSDIHAVSAEPADAPESGEPKADDLADSLAADGLSGMEANDVAAGIKRGAYLVTVDPPFGQAQRAISILKSFGPVDPKNVRELMESTTGRDDPAPVSGALGLRLLWDKPTPFSSFLSLPVLTKGQAPSVGLLSDRPAPISDALKLPTLTRDSR
jgi:hypothetical protein